MQVNIVVAHKLLFDLWKIFVDLLQNPWYDACTGTLRAGAPAEVGSEHFLWYVCQGWDGAGERRVFLDSEEKEATRKNQRIMREKERISHGNID